MKNLAIIPARSGSKGLKDKNILPLDRKPLLVHSIDAAFSSGCFDTVHVSTDSEKYAAIARQYGADVPFLRSAETSSDNATSWSAMLEVLKNYRRLGKTFDTVALLQPTSPLRTAEDIRRAYRLMEEKGAEAVVSVCEVEHSPLWCNTLPENNCMDGFLPPEAEGRRQALSTYYRLNGALYLLREPALQRQGKVIYNAGCYAYIMSKERSIDIDEAVDFAVAEFLLCRSAAYKNGGVSMNSCICTEDNNLNIAPPPCTNSRKYR